ncbi:CAZyme family AA7 [Paecilomyces variotii]|nr:CAZyme family AA7 [Paecilomyces variotii]
MQICLNLAGLFNIFSQSCRPVDLEHCCTALESTTLREKVLYPATAAYYSSVESYFAVNARLTPTCIVQPETADDVALAVSTLTAPNRIQKCQFAIRSGGHTSWAGAANIEQGVMVTGGRASPVGAGGITLGGGNSFFASRYGLVCDNVVNFEVVLANGEIVNANNQTNADLFKALKGGSNNFGIVTKIDFAAFEHTGVWGGVILHDISTTSQQIPAFVNFTDHVVDDPYASLITSWDYSSTRGKSVISNILVHTKPIERASSFDEVLAIPSLSSTMRLTDMHDLTEELHLEPEMRGRFLTLTFKNDPRLIQKALDLRDSSIKIAKAKARSSEWLLTAFFQPLPKLFSQHSVAKGGNVIGLDRFDENLLLFLVTIGWKDTVDDSLFDSLGKAAIEQLDAYAKELGADNEWIYLNYADVSQNPLRSYGEENLAEIRRVAEKYDPEHVFQYQVPGGFKVGRT